MLQSKGAVGLATSSATGKTEKIAKRVRESRGEERVKESDSAGGEGGEGRRRWGHQRSVRELSLTVMRWRL